MKEIIFPLGNGYAVMFTQYENGDIHIELQNPNGYIISDKKLDEYNIKSVLSLLS